MKHNKNIFKSDNYVSLFFIIVILAFCCCFLFLPVFKCNHFRNNRHNSYYNDTIDNNDNAIIKTYTVGGNGDIDYYTPGPKYIYGVGYTVEPGPAAVINHIYGDD